MGLKSDLDSSSVAYIDKKLLGMMSIGFSVKEGFFKAGSSGQGFLGQVSLGAGYGSFGAGLLWGRPFNKGF